ADFEVEFDFAISNVTGTAGDAGGVAGPDGLTFFVTDTPPAAPGGVGRDLGYAGLPAHSWAIECDAFQNLATNDPDSNHVGLDVGGSATSIATAPVFPNFETPGTWHARVRTNGPQV